MTMFKNILRRSVLLLLALSLFLTACGKKEPISAPGGETPKVTTPAATQAPTEEMPEPTQVATKDTRGKTPVVLGGDLPDDPVTSRTQTAAASPTEVINLEPTATSPGTLFVADQDYAVFQGGFGLSLTIDTYVTVRGPMALIGSREHPINTLIIGNVNKYEMVGLEELPPQIFASLFGGDAQLTQEDPEEIELDGVEGIAINYIARVSQMIVKGRLVMVKPTPKRYVAIIGMGDPADPSGDQWTNYGVDFFDMIVNATSILDDDELEAHEVCPISEDETYGYSQDNPIRVGGDSFAGPARARAFLDNLQNDEGQWLQYERIASQEYEGTILDQYSVYIGEEPLTLYIDRYGWDDLLTPVGFNCGGAYPLVMP